MQKKDCKHGFTLAEVLITLVIIGIIAAVTVLTLITKYQKITTANQIKKLYSTFNQAIRMAESENGPISYWEYTNVQELFDKYLKKYINNIKITNNIHVHGYLQNGILLVLQDGSQGICGYVYGGFSSSEINNYYACLLSPSGKYEWNNSEASLNGYTKPTHQIFWFVFDTTVKGFIPAFMNESRDKNISRCNAPRYYGNNGHTGCSELLMKDGWEFKDDYPWNIKL